MHASRIGPLLVAVVLCCALALAAGAQAASNPVPRGIYKGKTKGKPKSSGKITAFIDVVTDDKTGKDLTLLDIPDGITFKIRCRQLGRSLIFPEESGPIKLPFTGGRFSGGMKYREGDHGHAFAAAETVTQKIKGSFTAGGKKVSGTYSYRRSGKGMTCKARVRFSAKLKRVVAPEPAPAPQPTPEPDDQPIAPEEE